MKFALKILFCIFTIMLLTPLICLGIYDLTVFEPRVAEMRSLIANAAQDEQSPPEPILLFLNRPNSNVLNYVAKNLALNKFNLVGGNLHWLWVNVAWNILLPIHFSQKDRTTLFLNLCYMGKGTYGFAHASEKYFGVPLHSVSLEQAAKLFTIAKQPSYFTQNEDALEQSSTALLQRIKDGSDKH